MESRQHTDAHSRLIAITGPPGSGKTTLANALAKQFGLPLLSRDAIKEAAFDTFGWHDREWSKRVGALSYELLCHTIDLLLGTGGRFLVDTTLSPASAARINQLLVAHMTQATQVLLVVPPEVCLTRLRERHAVGDRHPGHADHQTLMDPDSWKASTSRPRTTRACGVGCC